MGCLFSLLVFVAALYYGVNIGELYFRYYRILDSLQTQARLAPGIDDGTIRRRIEADIQDILPDSSQAATDAIGQLEIKRTYSPRQIVIDTDYSESVHLPFFDHTFTFRPTATEPL